jgi:methionine-rich copper-binding protein CopC
MRRTLPLAALACALLLLPAVARAHATLVEADPGTQARLREAPSLIRLRFTEPVTVAEGGVQVLDRSGAQHAGAASVSGGGLVVTARLSGLERGSSYTLRWRVTSTDGHSPSGVYNFGVGVVSEWTPDSSGLSMTTQAGDDYDVVRVDLDGRRQAVFADETAHLELHRVPGSQEMLVWRMSPDGRRRELFRTDALPETAGAAKRSQTGFSRDAGARENDDAEGLADAVHESASYRRVEPAARAGSR